jgi:hypothetical protein
MIVREPIELAYRANQQNRERQADQQEAAWAFDQLDLQEIVKRWGSRQVLIALAEIHQQLTPDGSEVHWRILSRAYLTGGYDDPNPPCSCGEF